MSDVENPTEMSVKILLNKMDEWDNTHMQQEPSG